MYLLLLLSFPIHGADTARVYRQPPVVVTATRMPMSTLDAPSQVTSLDVRELSADGLHDFMSMISTVSGLFVKDYGPAQLQTISMRGTGAEQTLFLLDGISLNNIQNGEADMFLIPTNDISTIEISKGGASALYGANAVGGVVDLQTGNYLKNLVRLDAGAGSFGSQSFAGEVSQGIGILHFDLNLERRRAINNYGFSFQDNSGNIPMQRSGADYVINDQSLKIDLPASGSTSSLLIQNVAANRGTPGMVTDASFVGTAREIDQNSVAILKNTGSLGMFGYSATVGTIYSYLRYVDPSYESNDYYKTLSLQPALQLSYTGRQVSTTAGIDAEVDRGESDLMVGVKDRDRVGAFLSGMYSVRQGMDLETRFFGAVRLDGYSEFGSSFNPKLGLNLKPIASLPFHLRASIGTAYRVPTFNELYYAGLGNANLNPEKSVEYDFGGLVELPESRLPLSAILNVSYYHIDIKDGIVWRPVTSTIWLPENYDRILSTGIETGLHLGVTSLFSLQANYTFGKSVDLSDPTDPFTYEKQQLYIPESQSSVVATVSPWILSFRIAVMNTGRRYYTTDNSESMPAYTVTSISAGGRLEIGSIEIAPNLSVENLFNRQYEVIYQYPMPARTYRLDIGFQLNQNEPGHGTSNE